MEMGYRNLADRIGLLSALIPNGLVEARAWQRRFEAIGFPPGEAMREAVNAEARTAYRDSHIASLHQLLGGRLGLIVDAGANEGQWLTAILRFRSADRVLAFEPHPAACARLRQRVAGHSEVEIHQLALGEHAQSAVLNATRRSELSSLLRPRKDMSETYAGAAMVEDRVAIEVRPLDEFVKSRAVDLLKVDVQGYDRPLLAGARSTLTRTRVLLIEMLFLPHYEGEDRFADLYGLLTSDYGFRFWTMAPPSCGRDGRAQWTDALFVHEASA
jgi:FkbM family methyltransferase